MGNSALDLTAIIIAAAVALVITVVFWWRLRDGDRRSGWIAAGALAVILTALGIVDLMRAPVRETPVSTVIFGMCLPTLGTLGILLATARVKPWIRWPLAFLTAFVLLFGGLLLGAVLSRWLPF